MICTIVHSDLCTIATFERNFINNESYSLKELHNIFNNHNYIMLGFKIKKQLLGYLIAIKTDSNIDIAKIYVDKDYRHRGYAKQLLNQLIKDNEHIAMFVEVNETNHVAIKFYLQLGFVLINRRDDYYAPNVHAIILKRK
jgi:ribosomal protein S18 acetylase RimI-like enzyme